MASMRARNGRIYVDFRFEGQRCKEHTGLVDTAANRKQVAQMLKRIEAEITLGTFKYGDYFPDSPKAHLSAANDVEAEPIKRFEEFAEIWFNEKKVEWRQSYTDTIRVSLDKYLIPQFGKKRLTAITKASLLDFRAMLGRLPGIGESSTMSASRANHIMTPLRMILTEASDRYDFNNPWRNIKPLNEPRTKVEQFTLDEVKKLLRNVCSDFRPYYTVRFFADLLLLNSNPLQNLAALREPAGVIVRGR